MARAFDMNEREGHLSSTERGQRKRQEKGGKRLRGQVSIVLAVLSSLTVNPHGD